MASNLLSWQQNVNIFVTSETGVTTKHEQITHENKTDQDPG